MQERGFSGTQIHAAAIRTFLQSQGWDVTLLTPFSGWYLFRTAVFAVRYLVKHLSGQWGVFWYRHYHAHYLALELQKTLAKDPRPAILYAQDPPSAEIALAARRSEKDKVVLIVHFNDSQADEWMQRGQIALDGWVYRNIINLEERVLPAVDQVIFVSRYMQRRLLERIPALRSRQHVVVPNFVEIPEPDAQAVRRDVIAIGTLEPRKNQAYILQVLSLLRKRGRVLTATIVGGGEDRAKLEKMAHSLGVSGQVCFLGDVEGAAKLLAAHKVCCHAALLENCPITLIEALAAGVPVLAADVGGIAEVVDHTTGGFWDLASVPDGADRLAAMVENEPLLSRLRSNCIEKYHAQFAPEVAGRKLMNLFTGILES